VSLERNGFELSWIRTASACRGKGEHRVRPYESRLEGIIGLAEPHRSLPPLCNRGSGVVFCTHGCDGPLLADDGGVALLETSARTGYNP
jgi:hypothetical protein